MKAWILASGSSGNCAVVRTDETILLVDCGLTYSRLATLLGKIGITPGQLSGVVVSHQHGDHADGVASLCKKTDVVVHATTETLQAIPWGDVRHARVVGLEPLTQFKLGDLYVLAFPVPHDCPTVGFRISDKAIGEDDQKSFSIATDLASIPPEIFPWLHSDALLLEMNHDGEMLRAGGYKMRPGLAERVANTHLSNEYVCDWLRFMGPRVEHLVLGHLSVSNNNPKLVRMMATRALNGRLERGLKLSVATPDQMPMEVL